MQISGKNNLNYASTIRIVLAIEIHYLFSYSAIKQKLITNIFFVIPPKLTQMEIILIAAMAQNRIIGKDGTMPWHIPEELRFFKATTMGYPMIMGRKTFASFRAPLPGRRHIVLSRNANYRPQGGEYAASLDEALKMCEPAEKVFVIGGADIFQQGLAVATSILLTHLEREVAGDVSFPVFTDRQFVAVHRQHYPDGSEPYTVVTYRRVE